MQQAKIFGTRVPVRRFAPALLLVLNSLVWHTLTYSVLSDYAKQNLLILGVYHAGTAFAAVVGASLLRRSRETFLSLWMLVGAAVTAFLPFVVSGDAVPSSILMSLVFGVTVGVGFPSCLAYFADATQVENRGTYGGIAWSTVGFGVLLLFSLVSGLVPVQGFGVLAAWRFLGFVGFFFLARNRGKVELASSAPSYREILDRREVVLYLLPWIMFSLVNFVEAPILRNLPSYTQLAGFAEFAISGIFAIAAGMLADLVGRKRIVITGFILLGIEYAVFGLFSSAPAVWYVYTVLDGIAWGMFAAVFFMTVWGDLAGSGQKERFYLLGGLPYLVAVFLSDLVTPFINVIQATAAFSLASFFLFLAVLPLMYAPETLPEKRIRDRELRDYLKRAKKVKEKYV